MRLFFMVKSPPPGGMTERLMVTVLKTVVAQAIVGSNPTPSAGFTNSGFGITIGVPAVHRTGEVPERPIGLAC